MSNKVKLNIYKQQYQTYKQIELREDDIERYITIECSDCNGTGIFYITNEDRQSCVECKGSGSVWITVY